LAFAREPYMRTIYHYWQDLKQPTDVNLGG